MNLDLILSGGRVVDPSQGIDKNIEIGVHGQRIAALGDDLPRCGKTRVLDCRNLLLTPGLIDMHTHVYPGATPLGLIADEVMLQSATTTIVDAGSSGAANWLGLRDQVIARAHPQVLALIHLCTVGLAPCHYTGELLSPHLADPDGAIAIIRQNPTLAVGVKLRAGANIMGAAEIGWRHLHQAVRIARETDTFLMVHIGDTPMSVSELVRELAPGDVITHCYKGGPYKQLVLDANNRVFPDLLQAAQAGIVYDVGHGVGSFSWRVAEIAMDQGLMPTTISTDLHTDSVVGPVYNLPTTMSKFILLGMSLPEVVECCTIAPAKVIGRQDEIGSLHVGKTADISMLRLKEGVFPLTDSYGITRSATQMLTSAGVVRAGRVFA